MEERKCNCSPDCTCGCQEGKECTCENPECNCSCDEECKCGEECTCHDHEKSNCD